MNDGDERGLWFISYLHVHGWRPKRWQAPPKKYPSMPRGQWRRSAAICFAVGMVIGALLGRSSAGLALAAAILCGFLTVGVGMWIIETRWVRNHPAAPSTRLT